MKFLHPEFIYFMLPPLIILFALLMTQKEKQTLFFSDEVMEKLRVNSKRMSIRARNALFFLVGVLLVLSLAQPMVADGKVDVKAKSADIMIGLDISDSMLASDLYPSRLELAKHKILSLFKLAPTERFGVLAFTDSSYLVAPMSFDHEALAFLVSQLDPASITEKGTDIMQLLVGADKSMKEQKKRYLLLLSDGGDKSDFADEIVYAKAHNIKVYIIAVATQTGAPIKNQTGFITQNGKIVISKLNPAIATLATQTGGVYIEGVSSDKDIEKMYSEIEASVNEKVMKTQTITKYIPLFHIPIGFALFFLLLALSSMSKREVVKVPSIFILFAVMFASPSSHAGILDFKLLDDAKTAYDKGMFHQSSNLYENYMQTHDKNEANYNLANSLYKEKRYKQAAQTYKGIHFADKQKEAQLLYNLANAYAKSGDYQNAISSYNHSLIYKEDKDARTNKAIIEKLLQEQKQQEQEKAQKQQNTQQDQENDQKDQEQQQQNSKEQDQNTSQQNQQNQSQQNENQRQSSEEENSNMSTKEEQKWLQRLNAGTPTHLYRLTPAKKKDNKNEKPW
jgi:Ca-activated chloride channel family protein